MVFFFGAFLGRVMANEIGASWAIAIAAIFRFCLAVGWIFVPAADAVASKRRVSVV